MDTIEFTDIMSKHFVPYKLAMEMKALGFDEPCFGIYFTALKKDTNEPINCLGIDRTKGQDQYYGQDCSAPLWQQAFDWFRKNYQYQGNVRKVFLGDEYLVELNYKLITLRMYENESPKEKTFKTYEEGIEVLLENMIDLVKKI